MSAPGRRPRIIYGIVTEEADAIREGFVPSRYRCVGVWIEAGRILKRQEPEGLGAARKRVQTVDVLFGVKEEEE